MSDKCLILGSGFGLYGYLPAAVECGYNVIVPSRYYDRLYERCELSEYTGNVRFVDEDELFRKPDYKVGLVVIAKRPLDQVNILNDFIASRSLISNKIILEKPFARTPREALSVWDRLTREFGGISLRAGYSFIYTEWGKRVLEYLRWEGDYTLSIKWSFEAHHYKYAVDTWKRHAGSGGGALRFYGIQIIGVLSSVCGWTPVISNTEYSGVDEAFKWSCKMVNDNSEVDIYIDSMSRDECFECVIRNKRTSNDEYIYSSDSPFSDCGSIQDRRVVILKKIIESFGDKGDEEICPNEDILFRSLLLWKNIEDITEEQQIV